MNTLFHEQGLGNSEALEISLLLRDCFYVCKSETVESTMEDLSDDEITIKLGTIRFRHKHSDDDIRRTFVEFGRCFAAGSIAGGSSRNSNSVTMSQNLSDTVIRLSSSTIEMWTLVLKE